jgi:hypothetical protein
VKVHMAKVIKNVWGIEGAMKTTSLCGRLNNACRDGMNVTDATSQVTCKFCLALLKTQDVSHG